ncbi:hypothetical protein IW261DRAFT_400647 [Armillaria novae-zelandiae]|uniref:RED-like N-terminal domain-containing protein n=1 Tax=Armillaria novae-zelandiae TaxID=153914 RepID=A0AA39PSD2_9AGAR|nr:hypothetical protein IW261DRAFT_400647 [Armillaria novae-zelandiae]
MDQDSFRQLLQSSSSRVAPSSRPGVKQYVGHRDHTTGSHIFANRAKTISASEPAFKPRKVKKEAKYRDRAAERRVGGGNDYAQVEAILDDFNKRTADQGKDAVDAQRGYLGGDSEHTILVKGLDVALLEQNKVKAAASSVDDDTLEKTFLGEIPDSESTVPKKRTREDIVRELKAKRSKTGDSQQSPAITDAPLSSNKFKPIGFKPINQGDTETKKKKKAKKNGDAEKKKRRKVEPTVTPEDTTQTIAPSEPPKDTPNPLPTPPEPELPEDFDIFEGAGEYQGLDISDNDSDNDTLPHKDDTSPPGDEIPSRPGGWFNDDPPPPVASQSKSPLDVVSAPAPIPLPSAPDEDEEEDNDERPIRLVPLESSALPSIKDFLLMDKTAESSEKRRKRKEKNKGAKEAVGESKKLNAEAKADRDYKKLKSYQDKKAAGKS